MEEFRKLTVKKNVSWVNFNRNCPNCDTYIPKYKRVCPSCGKYVKSVQGKVLIAK
jgi:rRNA maturation endonuclease Nob1